MEDEVLKQLNERLLPKIWPEDLGGRLRALRVAHGLSLEEVAKIVGKHFTTITVWEKNRSQPSIASVEKLAELWGIPIDLLSTKSDKSRLVFVKVGEVPKPTIDKECVRRLRSIISELERAVEKAIDEANRILEA